MEANTSIPPVDDSKVIPNPQTTNKFEKLFRILAISSFLIMLVTLTTCIFLYEKHSKQIAELNNDTKTIPTAIPTAIVSPSIIAFVTEAITPTKIPPSPTVTPTSKKPSITPTLTPIANSLTIKLKSKNTTEPIDKFIGEITQSGNVLVTSFSGTNSEKIISDLKVGNYFLSLKVGDNINNYGCGYVNNYSLDISNNGNSTKEIEVLPYTGVIYLKTSDYYPISGARVSVTTENGNDTYYSTITDDLGRAVINTVSANPHWLKIEALNTTQVIKINNGKCLWSEVVKITDTIPRAKVLITINSATDWIIPQLIKKYEALTVNDPIPNFYQNDPGKYTFSDTLCDGVTGVTMAGNLSQIKNSDGTYSKSYEINNIFPGKYYICAYNPSKQPGSAGFKSELKEINLSPGENLETGVSYPGL